LTKTALLLIAHGSRQAEANDDLHLVAEELRRRGPYVIVVESFLELATPTIEQAAAECVNLQAQRVILLPYFLSAGLHVQRDLTAIRDRLAECYPRVEFVLAQPLGRHPSLFDVLLERARAADRIP
jgi:sirohydrochlorin ferrochelatase